MRNYIILNGNNSNEITGLLIQTLPPISQTKIRTQVEEIDGRDGDIITKLGYSAYNKEISIGLYGSYDVDDIIKYFTDNQSGQVTFSDEPDKYYNYEILDQVDFDKLIRYRTATVTLHCQPFKYSTTEEKIQINATEVSGSGSNITLNNTEDGALFTSLQINGDTSQNGTPTPSSPQEVHTITGENTIKVAGKNWFDINETLYSGEISKYNNGFTLTNNSTYRTLSILLPNSIPAGIYKITYEIKNSTLSNINKLNLSFRSSSSSVGAGNGNSTGETTITTTETADRMYIYINSSETSGATITLDNFMVSISGGAYEPYVSQTYSVNLGSIELCKIGDYQDYIYKENGNWYKYNAIGKVVLDGSETYTTWTSNRVVISNTPNNYKKVANNEIILALCSHYKPIKRDDAGVIDNSITFYSSSESVYGTIITDSINNTGTLLQDFISSNNISLYYVLATPTTTQITDTTLLSQLEALAGATTYLGQTNIITNGSDLNPLLEVTTFAVDDPSFIITNSGNINSKPIITIYGLGTVGLYLNGVQALSLNMGETTSQITIDVAKLEAYNQETGALMNRNVIGDYNNLSLNVGENTITESGTLQGIEIENYSRWL